MSAKEDKFWNQSPFDSLDFLELDLLRDSKFDFTLEEAGLTKGEKRDDFYICILSNWREQYKQDFLIEKVQQATIEKVNEFRLADEVNDLRLPFTLNPNFNNPFDYDFYMITRDRKKISFADSKAVRNALHMKNVWDITCLNFLSMNERQVIDYGESGDVDYIIFLREISLDDQRNKNVLPHIRRLNWLVSEEEFVSSRELVIMDYKKFFTNYERNENIIRLQVPASRNPSHNNGRPQHTVCFSKEANFCRVYPLSETKKNYG